MTAGYGGRINDIWKLDELPTVGKTLRSGTTFTVNRLASRLPDHGLTVPTVPEEGYVISTQVIDYLEGEVWLDGRSATQSGLPKRAISFYDLRQSVTALLKSPFDSIQFYLPKASFDVMAEDVGVRRVSELKVPLGIGVDDPVVASLAETLIPALENPDNAGAIFVDHVAYALTAHLAYTYGGFPLRPAPPGTLLSPSQERRAKELLSDPLQAELPLLAIANHCEMPVGRFIRAFRLTTGMPPYRWQRWSRIQRAKELLRSTDQPLAEISYACGFADQSHFTRVFRSLSGSTPGQWRRDFR